MPNVLSLSLYINIFIHTYINPLKKINREKVTNCPQSRESELLNFQCCVCDCFLLLFQTCADQLVKLSTVCQL